MIQTVASIPLPVFENLVIQKNRLAPAKGRPDCGKRISIVTGIHGDELEGQYVCYQVARQIQAHPEYLQGTVDLYPALNPLGISSVTRGIPGFDLDMNRIFPGARDGSMTEYMAAKIIQDVDGSDLALDIHASNIYLTEMPQIRINELFQDQLVDYARLANVDFIWVHGANTVLEATFAHSMNSRGVPTLVVEMGVGMRLTPAYGDQLTTGIFRLMAELGIWTGPVGEVKTPILSQKEEDVCYLNAPAAGIFLKEKLHGARLQAGERIGAIIQPLTGEVVREITAPAAGLLFTIREYPVVSEGSLLARILKEGE